MTEVNNPTDELENEGQDPVENSSDNQPEETKVIDAPDVNTDSDMPDIPEGTNLMQALIEAQKEATSYKEGWQRTQAEFANYKKRVERERTEMFQRASLDTLRALLPIIDDFDRAFENIPEDISKHLWVGGVSMIQRKFENLLEKYEIEVINPRGEPFDPNFHEAIGVEDSDEVDSGNVAITLQKGYKSGNLVLRPALVKVAS